MTAFIVLILLIALPITFYNWWKNSQYIEKVSKMDFQAKQLEMMKLQSQVSRYKTSHLLHLVLCLCTLGFWIPFWILVAISNGSQRNRIDKLMNTVSS